MLRWLLVSTSYESKAQCAKMIFALLLDDQEAPEQHYVVIFDSEGRSESLLSPVVHSPSPGPLSIVWLSF